MSATGFVDGPKSLFIILLCGLILLPLSVFAQGGLLDELEEETPCTAELVSEVKAYQPGVPFRLGVWIKPLPGWHGYWHSPPRWRRSSGGPLGPAIRLEDQRTELSGARKNGRVR